MRRGLAAVCLLLSASSFCLAEQRLYQLGPVPKAWQTVPPKPPPPKPPASPPSVQPEANASKWERDFSLPVDSPGFGKPVRAVAPDGPPRGAAPAGEGGHPGGGTGRPGDSAVFHQAGTLLVDSQLESLYLEHKEQDKAWKYLYSKGIIFSLDLHPDGPAGIVRLEDMPHPKETLLALVLGSQSPLNMVFRKEPDQGGLKKESWLHLGFPRIVVNRSPLDGRLVSAQLMAPGGQKVVSTLWRVKEWKGAKPFKIVSTNFGPGGQSISSETLYTLVESSPARVKTADDIFSKGMKVLDQRAELESSKVEVSYPWSGRLPTLADLKQMDQESSSPLPGFLKGTSSALTGVLLLTGVCGSLLAIVLVAKKSSLRPKA